VCGCSVARSRRLDVARSARLLGFEEGDDIGVGVAQGITRRSAGA
jgi:hypothetical protein